MPEKPPRKPPEEGSSTIPKDHRQHGRRYEDPAPKQPKTPEPNPSKEKES